ncbi:MAG TPA: hydroxymethylbilane synthase [Gemmatimonadaceae bacterium]|nr:hydroxymethylbilane synthase [Gemmatimonadaceae bacterium]
MRTYRLGTRASKLARTQSAAVRAELERLNPGATFTEVLLTSAGDADSISPLPSIGGEGIFVGELERALRADEIDLAVHSLKDVPIKEAGRLTLAAIGSREDARDVLVSQNGWTLATLPRGARVGTCSLRRSAQLLAARPDLTLFPLRGNVDSRVRQVRDGAFDAIVLAAAGLHRLGMHDAVAEYLPLDQMLPAPAQGALAVQCRDDDLQTWSAIAPLNETPVRAATDAERGFLEGLGGGCTAPIAAYAVIDAPGRLHLRTVVASLDGQRLLKLEETGNVNDGRALGLALAARARANGAAELLA